MGTFRQVRDIRHRTQHHIDGSYPMRGWKPNFDSSVTGSLIPPLRSPTSTR